MKEVFVIEKLSIYSGENHPLKAYKYYPIYFVSTEEEAENIVERAGEVDRNSCWAFDDNMPVCKYYKLRKRVEVLKII